MLERYLEQQQAVPAALLTDEARRNACDTDALDLADITGQEHSKASHTAEKSNHRAVQWVSTYSLSYCAPQAHDRTEHGAVRWGLHHYRPNEDSQGTWQTDAKGSKTSFC